MPLAPVVPAAPEAALPDAMATKRSVSAVPLLMTRSAWAACVAFTEFAPLMFTRSITVGAVSPVIAQPVAGVSKVERTAVLRCHCES
jgi:hypothetical protein